MMRFCYADPPYIGQARKHYRDDPLCAEVDHAELIARLDGGYDGWALSMSSPSLRVIAPLVPERARFCVWIKPFCAFKANVTRAYAWEPVIVVPLRERPRTSPTIRDWVSAGITMKRGLVGAKPAAFCDWLFEFAGLEPGDEFHDLFPGTGAVTRAWERFASLRRADLFGDVA
jgi:hypothetical protein